MSRKLRKLVDPTALSLSMNKSTKEAITVVADNAGVTVSEVVETVVRQRLDSGEPIVFAA